MVQKQHVIGRESELGAIDGFLAAPAEGPWGLLIEGEAGIGKTTLWQAGVEAARERGFRVLIARIGAAETKLSYAALSDLLEPVVDEALPDLPEPQRAALEVAMLRVDTRGPAPEQLAVSVAALGVLRFISLRSPVLVALDDLQWLDASSARVLGSIVRRLRDEPIGVLASVRLGVPVDRLGLDRLVPSQRSRQVFVGPMPHKALARLLRERIRTDLPHPVLQRVDRQAGGNPMFALEIAKELDRLGVPTAGEALPVPHDLRDLLRGRLEALPRNTRTALLVAAATSRATERLVGSVMRPGPRVAAALAEAEQMGVVRIEEGRISFTHPLLASTAYEAASGAERRRTHRRLAEHVEDPEERARHLALAAEGPDAEVASALDEASHLAGARGAPEAAAELSELARRLTPPNEIDALRRRTVEAAQHHFDAGDATRSTALLVEAIESAPPGHGRALIRFLSGSRAWMDLGRVGELCGLALTEAEGDTDLLATAHEHLAWVAIYRGDLKDASRHAEASVEHARALSSPANLGEALGTFGMVEFLLGRPAHGLMAEADRQQDVAGSGDFAFEASVYTSPKTCHGLQLLWAGELDAAREILQLELSAYETRGRYIVRDEVLGYLAELECRAGNWEVAARYAEEAVEIDMEAGRLTGTGHTLFNRALVAAHRGDVEAARSDAEEGLRISIANQDPFYTSCNRAVLGFVELSRSEPARAMEHLRPVLEYLGDFGTAEPGVIPFVPDAIECLVAVGDLDAAERLLEEHEDKGRRLDRPWASATALRCRGLLVAARGDPLAGLEALERAVEEHERVPQLFELGRTLLVKGEVARRGKRKTMAREAFEEALSIFEEVGAKAWSAKARAELDRVAGAGAGSELTPTERRVVTLVVDGRTNREIADALFISVKTVEANLSRIFHKLGVRSRAQLVKSTMDPGSGLQPGGFEPVA